VLSLIEVLPRIYDEPFADYSQIPTALIASFAKQKVKVVLTGDGGDEMFSGYNRYVWAPSIMSAKNYLPPFVKRLAVKLLLSEQTLGLSKMLQALPQQYRIRLPDEKLNKTASFLQASSEHEAYLSLLSSWQPPVPVMHSHSVDITHKVEDLWASQLSFAEKMRHTDALIYLPDDVLVKVDRATMAYGLEARSPFLDSRIIAFTNRLPNSLMQNGHKGKLILRNWLKQHLPDSYVDRPKSGFSFPLADWLRGPLRPWANELLTYDRLIEEAYFQADTVKTAWDDHLAMKADNHGLLWPILMFQAWNNY
jgi:asparagine synthase (glutamine-hydrolysing)